jgi:thymidylate synthase
MTYTKISDIRASFKTLLRKEEYVTDKTGVKLLELIGTSFLADETYIFGQVNDEYVQRELQWYISQSLYIKDIPGKTPKIWETVASTTGRINSNYGWCIWSEQNYTQYNFALNSLAGNRDSRRAIMIYTRPKMQIEFGVDDMSDFICTNTVQYMIRNNQLHCIVQMRSNDIVYGYRNDYAWQLYVLNKLLSDYNRLTNSTVLPGNIHWAAGSLHVYERHFPLILNSPV